MVYARMVWCLALLLVVALAATLASARLRACEGAKGSRGAFSALSAARDAAIVNQFLDRLARCGTNEIRFVFGRDTVLRLPGRSNSATYLPGENRHLHLLNEFDGSKSRLDRADLTGLMGNIKTYFAHGCALGEGDDYLLFVFFKVVWDRYAAIIASKPTQAEAQARADRELTRPAIAAEMVRYLDPDYRRQI